MKKPALVFLLAVFVPSLVLAWLAVRSLRDQQFVLERQQSLLCQGVADALAKDASAYLDERLREFGQQVEVLLADAPPGSLPRGFDEQLCKAWPLSDVGFAVKLGGELLAPSPLGRPEARAFYIANGSFLCSREPVEVYWNSFKGPVNLSRLDEKAAQTADASNPSNIRGRGSPSTQDSGQQRIAQPEPSQLQQRAQVSSQPGDATNPQQQLAQPDSSGNVSNDLLGNRGQLVKNPSKVSRSVQPQQQGGYANVKEAQADNNDVASKVTASEAEFRQLIGEADSGMLARFLDNKLRVMFWYRPPRDPQLVFGSQLDLKRLVPELRKLVVVEPALEKDIAVALVDDAARPVAVSHPGFQPASWKRPLVATEVGEALPHWELAVYLLDPTKSSQVAKTLALTVALIVLVLLGAIGAGGWLMFADVRRQLTLARQKTDFVSNVSHELKTPLTSIRMFSELLAEGRVSDPAKQRSYLQIITAETARLTRLINNVLDFSRMERGDKKYNFTRWDLGVVIRETAETYRPHLEQNGFKLELDLPPAPVEVNGDRDALAQVFVNLLSNAEKYSSERKEIRVELRRREEPLPHFEARVLDRGFGVPKGCETRIFEQFFRAHDSLGSGIQGSGLGLTLARQIARAHGGEVVFEPREGGGSCFALRLPIGKGNHQ
jgi:signal transduction histidine kinase